jgi:thioredoxin-related protein
MDFVRRFGRFPVRGKQLEFNPYLDARVMDVFETHAVLELSMKPEERIEQVAYGTTRVFLEKDQFVIQLIPDIGAPFEVGDQKGWITAADEHTFTVDFNHPMAGEAMILDLIIVDFIKASRASANEITWLEDYDTGSKLAASAQKPMVLLLYADWCQWSRKLMADVLRDPRITHLHDRFVWIKIDSDLHREYKAKFEQESYPKLLVLDPEGRVINALDGFNNAGHVSKVLREIAPPKLAG